MTIEIPVVNINGSSPETMVEDISAALSALHLAKEAVAKTAPHPRDWQTVKDGDALCRVASAHHRARMRVLDILFEELQAIGIGIQDQQSARRRRS
jgi:hypothetical protein